MQKIMTCLFFDGKAEEAIRYYVSVLKDAKLGKISYYGDHGPMPKGSVMTVGFEIGDQSFLALNGPPMFSFSPAISLMVNCDTQAEIDDVWEKLSDGGEKQQCGWLKDRYGLSWQIVPTILGELMNNASSRQSQSMMNAVMKMTKLDINTMKRAYEQA